MSTTDNLGQSGTGVSAGRVLGGRYRLDALIASGGMGEVYRATRLHIGDQVAVKALRSELVDNATTRERFQREARAAARLRHPNAVVIHDFGEEPDGVVFIVMELLDGRSLRQVLEEEGSLEPARVNRLLKQICAVLHEGHKQGIVHRDLKPENIMLVERPDTGQGRDEQVKLLDFGIAKLLDKAVADPNQESRLTKVGTLIGTPTYMSPEQFEGESVDERTDIYSLGIVLFELLTGQVPFTAKTPTGVAIKHVMDTPPRLRELQPGLNEAIEQVVLRALEKKPGARQSSMPALAREFAEAVSSSEAGRLHLESSAPAATPSAATLTDPATQILTAQRDTHEQRRATQHQRQSQPSYDTVVSAKVEPAPAASESEPFDTNRLISSAKAAAPDNSPAAVLARLKAQPLLLGVVGGIVLLALFGWWFAQPQPETAPLQAETTPTPTTTSSVAATPAPTTAPASVNEKMVYIPGGALLLNATPDGKCPTVVVTLKPYYLDKHEVTNEEYLLYLVANNAARPPSWKDGQFPAGAERLPVTDVSWEDAANYADWVGKRLPTEAEWEFAARGTNDWVYPWGNEWRSDYANAGSNQLRAVGSYAQAGGLFGALDLIGNAAEWTASDYSTCAKAEAEATSSESASKVVRGGSHESAPKQATATFRQGLPAKRQNTVNLRAVGFRCARDAQ